MSTVAGLSGLPALAACSRSIVTSVAAAGQHWWKDVEQVGWSKGKVVSAAAAGSNTASSRVLPELLGYLAV